MAFVLLQSVPVLATGTKVEQGESRDGRTRTFTTITLDVNAEQARQVIAAREIGKITALLRAPGDKGAVSGTRDDAAALLGLVAPASAARRGVPVIYGGMGPLRSVPRLEAAPGAQPGAMPKAPASPSGVVAGADSPATASTVAAAAGSVVQ
jgi:pilus assembly protein CpaB